MANITLFRPYNGLILQLVVSATRQNLKFERSFALPVHTNDWCGLRVWCGCWHLAFGISMDLALGIAHLAFGI